MKVIKGMLKTIRTIFPVALYRNEELLDSSCLVQNSNIRELNITRNGLNKLLNINVNIKDDKPILTVDNHPITSQAYANEISHRLTKLHLKDVYALPYTMDIDITSIQNTKNLDTYISALINNGTIEQYLTVYTEDYVPLGKDIKSHIKISATVGTTTHPELDDCEQQELYKKFKTLPIREYIGYIRRYPFVRKFLKERTDARSVFAKDLIGDSPGAGINIPLKFFKKSGCIGDYVMDTCGVDSEAQEAWDEFIEQFGFQDHIFSSPGTQHPNIDINIIDVSQLEDTIRKHLLPIEAILLEEYLPIYLPTATSKEEDNPSIAPFFLESVKDAKEFIAIVHTRDQFTNQVKNNVIRRLCQDIDTKMVWQSDVLTIVHTRNVETLKQLRNN